VTGPATETATPEAAPPRAPIPCPRCGATVEGDQGWCLECGLAARTRLAPTPNWRAPLIAAGAVGLAAIVALIVAFLVVTGDNAPLPTTAAPAPAATAPAATTPATTPTSTVATPTTPGTTPTVPAIPTTSTPAP
jgi:hypothetical protein